MKTQDFIYARGMNSDVQTVKMLQKEAFNILKAEEIYEGAYRITMISGEERIINQDEMTYLRDLLQDNEQNNDFDIYYLNGDVTTAVC